ncbi:hypothetical protein H0H93_015073 [Arthromyces matolae]|nr:hypothetical protein H0H93_015073 [Arthromyces matolae]
MNHLKSFLTGARFFAADSLKPSWIALYDIDDTSTFEHESYTCLRANRSPREGALVVRLETLDRRTCEALVDSGESQITSSLASSNPTTFIITHGVNVTGGGSVEAWADDSLDRLKRVKGWVRTRLFKVNDNLKTGLSVAGKGPEEQRVAKYFVLHGALYLGLFQRDMNESRTSSEFESSAAETPEFTNIIVSHNGFETVERRSWHLYRAYPGIAQGNLPV